MLKTTFDKDMIGMNIEIRTYTENDLTAMTEIWNEVVEDGIAFPQEELLTDKTCRDFFGSQTYCGVAEDTDSGRIMGLYIGEKLVSHCITQGKECGFKILQFNAVVASNIHARHLYERLGFTQLGTIPGGFRMKDGRYEDICPYYREL